MLPFILLNFLFGLTGVPFIEFFIATFVGISPAIILFVYIGSVLGDLTKLGTPLQNGPWSHAVAIGGITISIVISFFVTRVARHALASRLPVEGEIS